MSLSEGYRRGADNLKAIAEACDERGIKYLSAYVFSNENWKRDKTEIRDLFRLCMWMLKHEIRSLHEHGVRLRVLGSRLRLGKAMIKAIHDAEKLTENNTRCTVLLCLDYGGQREIADAVKRIVGEGIPADDITPELISQYLYAADVPPVDLVIRTSGEQRMSNFMTWETVYSELVFDQAYWPDFDVARLDAALAEYSRRQRRVGV